MSGGHYDYIDSQIAHLATEMREDCDRYTKGEPNEYGEIPSMPEDILAHMRYVAGQVESIAEAVHDIDYLISGDYGEDCLRKRCESWKLSEHLRTPAYVSEGGKQNEN